jgi:bifunctional non-homologous end joining protein LigD
VRLTNPDRILYPEQRITKRSLALFYDSIAAFVLPHVSDRPLTLLRCPRGRGGQCFYQKHAGTGALPHAVHRIDIREKEGRGTYLTVDSIEGLIGLVQLGVLEFHTWNATKDHLENPDRMIFDLDPDPSVPWEGTIEAARLVRNRLLEVDLESFLKTTGGKGLHVVVPLEGRNGWAEVRELSRGIAESIARARPRQYTTQMSKAKREGRIFIDYLRNVRGATAVAAYSTRARPGAPVSTPLRWSELKPSVRSDSFTVTSLPRRLSKLRSDPWSGFASARATISAALLRKFTP